MTKILIANRGEIAVRIIRACRELGLASVAVYSDCDRTALHVRQADEAAHIGSSLPSESYLRIETMVETARHAGADAVHPGYGFLSENPAFARACRDAHLTFIGPSAEAIELMGSKTAARRIARAAGVSVVPGTDEPLGPDTPSRELRRIAADVGYPLLVKAVAGGGGRGMRLVSSPDDLEGAVGGAQSEARTAFGDPAIYFERRISRPRHIEVQILADHHGMIVPFVERECSVQRRHQKLIEETPSMAVTESMRHALADAATRIAKTVAYTNAGTVEFLLDEEGRFYFLEMNTRLQVEHPITEAASGVDLVHWQIRLAGGAPLTLSPQKTMAPGGHAIECRIYAEDPDEQFLPCPGRITTLRPPAGPGVRDDGGFLAPADVPIFYDALVSKLVVWDQDRPAAIARMRRALDEYDIRGIKSTIPFFQWMLRQPGFVAGRLDTGMVDRILAERNGQPFRESSQELEDTVAIAAALYQYLNPGVREALPATPARASTWVRQARREALR